MSLADAVLPLIRTRADLHRWSTANAHGAQMNHAVDLLDEARATSDPAEVYDVTHRALASAVTVIARADDSSGIIGDACRRLLALHPVAATAAAVPVRRLVDWMMDFQFRGVVDYFEIDPVAYAPALGEAGLADYRSRLRAVEDGLGEKPGWGERWSSSHSHEWFVLLWNEQRLAVLDRDVEAIIRTHAGDQNRAAFIEDAALALEEIGEIDLAISWARRATEHGRGHQSQKAAASWLRLLAEHRPHELLDAQRQVFDTWPSASTAGELHRAARERWPELEDEVMARLAPRPDQAVSFALHTLKDPQRAWQLAHSLGLDSDETWSVVVKAYEKIDPAGVLPVHRRLVESQLVDASAQNYRRAAKRLVTMRSLARKVGQLEEVDAFIADLRELHRRRPRLQQEFDRARLP